MNRRTTSRTGVGGPPFTVKEASAAKNAATLSGLRLHQAFAYRAAKSFISSLVTTWNNYRSDVINGILKCVQCRIDLRCVEIDDMQCLWRKTKFSAARKFDECWKF